MPSDSASEPASGEAWTLRLADGRRMLINADVLTAEKPMADYYEAAVKAGAPVKPNARSVRWNVN